jgi:Tfp pilus assembly protein PilO
VKASDRAIIFGVAVAALAIGFYLLVLGPKRDKAGELGGQISDLHASISAAQEQASYGEQARKDFPRYYGRMVVLGKAVPAESDTASMLVQLNSITDRSKLDFRELSLSQGASGTGTSSSSPSTSTPTTPPATTAPASSGTATTPSSTTSTTPASGGTTGATAPASTSPAPATEASAATLPIGAVVGPAGLPTLPYSLKMTGTFFDVADFIGRLDGLVKPTNDTGTQLSPDGRLFTVNGFSLKGGAPGSSPTLDASFLVTTYATGDQGLTAGASPSGPAPVSPSAPQAEPASSVVAQ